MQNPIPVPTNESAVEALTHVITKLQQADLLSRSDLITLTEIRIRVENKIERTKRRVARAAMLLK